MNISKKSKFCHIDDYGLCATPIKILRKRLKTILSAFHSLYSDLCNSQPTTDNERILFENYFTIEKNIKLLLKNKSKLCLTCTEQNIPIIAAATLEKCSGGDLPDLQELIDTFSKLQESVFISSTSFSQIEFSVAYAAIDDIYRCVFASKSQCGLSLIELISILVRINEISTEDIIESCDPIEQILKLDPTEVYSRCDRTTKAMYRRYTVQSAIYHGISETESAEKFLEMANAENKHIGFFILNEYKKIQRRMPDSAYIGTLFAVSASVSLVISVFCHNLILSLLFLFPVWEIIRSILDYVLINSTQTEYIPRLSKNSDEVKSIRPIFVISTLIDKGTQDELFNRMVDQYYTDSEQSPIICALCDLPACDTSENEKDNEILNSAQALYERLCRISDSFIVLIRRRSRCNTMDNYCGRERKRGAILSLCELCVEKKCDDFLAVYGNTSLIFDNEFLILLDSDTKSGLDSASSLIACACHPLNVPIIENGRVKSGYAVFSPNMVTTLKSSLKTPFSKLFGGIGSTSAYDTMTPNLYQDVFDEGIFCGKGLIHTKLLYTMTNDFFPDEKILSHDILEGAMLRCAFVGDVDFLDSYPTQLSGYMKRDERWIRGDIQNSPYILGTIRTKNGKIKNPFSLLDRFKLFDNIRRAVTPIIQFFILFLGFALQNQGSKILAVTILSILLPFFIGFAASFFHCGISIFSRKYYSGILNRLSEIIASALLRLMFLPILAINSLLACLRSVYRMIVSHKKLLEWQTFAQTEAGKKCIYRYAFTELLIFILIFSPVLEIRFMASIWIFSPFCAYLLSRPYVLSTRLPADDEQEELRCHVQDMWNFYRKYCTAKENHLPPDNVQFAPVYRVCRRTSPTNIGMYLLSCLAVYDFEIIDKAELLQRISDTVKSIERLKKYEGNLYNWYETKNLEPSGNPFISSVDSGNFLCCVTALIEGLRGLKCENADSICKKLEEIVKRTDLSVFYNEKRGLFSVGINPEDNSLAPHYYDLLMSESRMTGYFAVASKSVAKEHWRRLGRTMKRVISNGHIYSGAVAYSGTMFEYFMPEILLRSEKGSLSYESLRYALFCQKLRMKKNNLPYGISESAYFAFDNSLNYQYKAHGVQSCGLKRGLDSELVVSPYSTYLTLQTDFKDAYENLMRLKEYGMYGTFGFYEAVDFTNGRGERFGTIIKSYMAHHVGMSICSCANAVMNGIMQNRFMMNRQMASARELLAEKHMLGSVVFEGYNEREQRDTSDNTQATEFFESFSPSSQKIKLMSNGEYTLACSNSGLCFATYRGHDVYAQTTEPLTKPSGIFMAFEKDERIYHLCYYPTMQNSEDLGSEFGEDHCTFYRNGGGIECGMRVCLHNTMPCEIRQLAFKNSSGEPQTTKLLAFIEPVLQSTADYYAHPAFSKLFLKLSYDFDRNCVVVSRKDRHGNEKLFCAVGFLEEINFSCCFSREKVLSRPKGTLNLFENEREIENDYSYIPDPCIFLRHTLKLNPHEQKELHMFILTADNLNELLSEVDSLREGNRTISRSMPPIWEKSIEGRIASSILPSLILKRRDSSEQLHAISANSLKTSELFKYSLSPDIPIVLVEVVHKNDFERISAYLKAYKALRLCSVKYSLVFTCNDTNEYGGIASEITSAICELGLCDAISSYCGIFICKISYDDKAMISLFRAVAVHTAPQSLVRIGAPLEPFDMPRILSVDADKTAVLLTCGNGGFTKEGFAVNDTPPNVWSHILASQQFGTLLSSDSLGFSYAINSFENKLTPWRNDSAYGNCGERLILKIDDKLFDIVNGAAALFDEGSALYKGKTSLFSSQVRVTVSSKGMCKRISVKIKATKKCNLDIAFYTEPVLAVDRRNSRILKPAYYDGAIVVSNPCNLSVSGFMAVSSSLKCNAITSQDGFFRGRWHQTEVLPSCDCCAALIHSAENKSEIEIDFFISFGATRASALIMPKLFEEMSYKHLKRNTIQISTPDKPLDHMFNHQLFMQTVGGRIFARTGFYQNSGAFGFRDQLQDACCAILESPDIALRIICRACTAQFIEGDVLHWWHSLPNNKMRGVRTKISDDLVFLPYTVAEFVEKTSNRGILGLNIRYCEGLQIPEGEHEIYGEVSKSNEKQSIYNHCKAALNKAFCTGKHGLILMGSGDWNDSFNGVGIEGEGESVWLSQFMIIVLKKFADICSLVGDDEYRRICFERASFLTRAVSHSAWDGEWYIRAFFDNGEPLGSKLCKACKIDSLAQSFAVLASLPNEERNEIALNSAISALCDKKNGIIKLFTPAFEGGEAPVGYASSYPPGIRENGGQYTHAAIWLAAALFEAKRGEDGFELTSMLNPFNHSLTEEMCLQFKNEPYYMTADIYTNPQCTGRGGWSIYTGAGGWYYRLIFEWFLGIKIQSGKVTFSPTLPREWDKISISLNYLDTKIDILIQRGENDSMQDNGKDADFVPIDRKTHKVVIYRI